MIKEHIEGLGDFEFYEGYFIGRIDAGVNAGYDFVDVLSELIQKHSFGQPIIYISDRVHSYSLDPIATTELISRNNIRYAGVVTHTLQQMKNYTFEESLIEDTTMRAFNTLDAAVNWAEQKLLEIT